jgi:hypothetical protein
MNTLQSKYDGTDQVAEMIGRLIDYISVERPSQGSLVDGNNNNSFSSQRHDSATMSSFSSTSRSAKPKRLVNDWGDVFLRQPSLYLRLTLTIDLSLTNGCFPRDSDFPTALQSQNMIETPFPLYHISVSMGETISTSNPKIIAVETEDDSQIKENAKQGSCEAYPNTSIALLQNSSISATNCFIGNSQALTIQGLNQSAGECGMPLDFETFDMPLLDQDTLGLYDYSLDWAGELSSHR